MSQHSNQQPYVWAYEYHGRGHGDEDTIFISRARKEKYSPSFVEVALYRDVTPHFNGLTPAEAERLAMLAEECAEVIQAVGKVLRHGYSSHNPDAPELGTNRQQLAKELVDVEAVRRMMIEGGELAAPREQAIAATKIRKHAYAHHQVGSLDRHQV